MSLLQPENERIVERFLISLVYLQSLGVCERLRSLSDQNGQASWILPTRFQIQARNMLPVS